MNKVSLSSARTALSAKRPLLSLSFLDSSYALINSLASLKRSCGSSPPSARKRLKPYSALSGGRFPRRSPSIRGSCLDSLRRAYPGENNGNAPIRQPGRNVYPPQLLAEDIAKRGVPLRAGPLQRQNQKPQGLLRLKDPGHLVPKSALKVLLVAKAALAVHAGGAKEGSLRLSRPGGCPSGSSRPRGGGFFARLGHSAPF